MEEASGPLQIAPCAFLHDLHLSGMYGAYTFEQAIV